VSQPVAAADLPLPEREPWARYGWLMGTIWLGFLAFPLTGIVSGGLPLLVKLAAVTCILAFAAIYVLGLVRMNDDAWGGSTGKGVGYVAALTALTLTAVSLAGEPALGTTPFIVAFGMFALPLRTAGALLAVVVATVLVLPLALESFSHSWYVAPVVLTVGLATATVRVLEDRQTTYRTMADEITLAAERDRVARDVHDVLGHSLTVVTVKAELAERLVDVDPDRARAELAEIQSLTRQSLAEIRATVAGLRVARLTDELEAASGALTDSGVECAVPGDPSLVDPRHRIVLAWALREAVTNVVRHSDARTCVVRFGADWLEVTDDGRGMGGHKEGSGLRGLRERVRGAGGTVEVVTAHAGLGTPAGTTVRVQL